MTWLFWALLSALFAAVTAVLAKVGVENVDSNLATAIRTSVILVFAWAVAFATVKPGGLAALTGRTWLFLALSGLATGLSWLCYFRALQLGEVTQVAPIDKLSVVIAIVIAIFALGERPSLREALGAGLITCGAIVLAWK